MVEIECRGGLTQVAPFDKVHKGIYWPESSVRSQCRNRAAAERLSDLCFKDGTKKRCTYSTLKVSQVFNFLRLLRQAPLSLGDGFSAVRI